MSQSKKSLMGGDTVLEPVFSCVSVRKLKADIKYKINHFPAISHIYISF
jgi:hypothetical protein